MKEAINTALLFIGSFYSVNTVMFQRPCPEFQLPSKFADIQDHAMARRFLEEAPEKAVCYLRDHLFLEYCVVTLESNAVLIGPFRSRNLHHYDLDLQKFKSDEEIRRYLKFYHSQPVLLKGPLRVAVSNLFLAVYGSSDDVQEVCNADLSEENLTNELDYLHDLMVEEAKGHNPNAFYDYMEQVSVGNYDGAIRAYKQAMISRTMAFNLVRTIEGITSVRTQTRLALHRAGISEEAISGLLNSFKVKGRMLTSVTEARNLCEQLIYDSCKLVRDSHAKKYSPTVADAVSYIHHNLEHPLSVPEIAEHVGVTPNSLSAKFHAEVGSPPMVYINKLRMEQAQKLLRNTKLSIPEICYRIGIMDSNYFTRCFKKEYGMPPREYRKINTGKK